MHKTHDDFDSNYRAAVKEVYQNLGDQFLRLRLERNLTLNESLNELMRFLKDHPIDWTPHGQGELLRLEEVIQIALYYGKKVHITLK